MKRLMYSLLTLGLAMLFLTPSHAQDADVDALKASDVNADGIVNILDLVFVATHLGEIPTEKQHPNPDVNGDGTVNILDLVLVAQHLGKSTLVITSATVSDGEKDVDPAAINEDRIEITFSEEVTGNIVLQTEDGHDVGWLVWIDGDKAALEPIVGKEIGYETTYVIRGTVADAAGNETEISITFTTRQGLVAEENLVNHWAFDEGKGDVVEDAINRYDGELFGGKWVDGRFGTGLELDGVNDRVVVRRYQTFDMTVNMTCMAWFYPTNTLTNRAFIVKHGAFHVGFGEQNQIKFVIQPHDISVESTNNNWTLRQWYHLAVTFDGETMKVYIDGELNSEMPNDIPIPISKANLVIGQGFSGIIDEVRFYDKALSQDEIKSISIEGF